MASFGGSWSFILFFAGLILLWIGSNTVWIFLGPFDPYPFIFLNLILSCLAAVQAPIIMMSQNRHEEKDRKQARNDYIINLKSEMQVRNLHQKFDVLMVEQMKNLFEIQRTQLEKLEELNRKIDALNRK